MSKDLTKGPILTSIIKLSLPIIGASFLQFAYNFTDMLWVGRLGSDAVAAIGTSGFYLHLSWAVASVFIVGASVKVAHAVGEKKDSLAKKLSFNAFIAMLVIILLYAIAIQFGYKQLIGFFDLNNINAESQAHDYIKWASLGMIFAQTTSIFSAFSNAHGDSTTPFRITIISVILNIALDPLFIFTFGLGCKGAAIATLISQMVAAIIFWSIRHKSFFGSKKERILSSEYIKRIAITGFPISLQRIIFSVIAIFIAKIIAHWGSDAIAAQRIGLQIESMAFMTIGGLSGALLSFTGQNFGAREFYRVRKGYNIGMLLSVSFGIMFSAIFIIFAEPMVRWFVQEDNTVAIGVSYLRIIGISPFFMALESISSGVINGIGKTKIPAAINIAMTVIRIPAALILSQEHILGINGVWVAIVSSTALRGIILVTSYNILKGKFKNYKTNENEKTA